MGIIIVVFFVIIFTFTKNRIKEEEAAERIKKEKENEYKFLEAIKNNDKLTVQELIEKGIDVNILRWNYSFDFAENEEITREKVAYAALRAGDENYRKNYYYLAFDYFQRAADLGNADAQYRLGICYLFGEGVLKDEKKGIEWLKKAAEKGHYYAAADIGVCYFDGIGVTVDYSKAFYWLKKPAEQGICKAQLRLGICYDLGHGVTENPEKAIEWYTKAAEQGNADAQRFLEMLLKKRFLEGHKIIQ